MDGDITKKVFVVLIFCVYFDKLSFLLYLKVILDAENVNSQRLHKVLWNIFGASLSAKTALNNFYYTITLKSVTTVPECVFLNYTWPNSITRMLLRCCMILHHLQKQMR